MPKIERIKKRHLMKIKEQKDLLDQLSRDLDTPITASKEWRIEEGELEDGSRVFLSDGVILFFESSGRMLPTLRVLLDGAVRIPEVAVDMGAVRFVTNGADVMRPGVTRISDGIARDSVVAIVDERHGKPLAVGISIMSSEEMRAAASGKVVMNRHYVGDPYWEFGKA
jgi:PUA domain protein